MALPPTQLAALVAVAVVAGLVDAIAGGGGLLTLPVLVWTGLPPHVVLGTNKGQAVWGAAAATLGYTRAGLVDRPLAPRLFAAGFVGSLAGAALVSRVAPATLRPLVLGLLVTVALVLAGRPALLVERAGRREVPVAAALARGSLLALAIGAYDGFFGPGTGTFLIVGFALALGQPLARASGNAKVVNLASNLAALLVFAARGQVLWGVALPMAAGQAVGASIGARLASRRGAPLVRWTVVVVAVALSAKLALDWLRAR